MAGRGPRATIEAFLPFAILLTIFLLGFVTLRPFLPAMVWALVLGIALAPLHARIEAASNGSRLVATLLVTLLMLVVLVLPMLALSRALMVFIPDALAWLQKLSDRALNEHIAVPAGASFLEGDLAGIWNTLIKDIAVLQRHVGTDLGPAFLWLLDQTRLLGAFLLELVLGVVLAALILNQRDRATALFERIVGRIGGESGSPVATQAVRTVRSAVWGILGAAAAQTVAASVIYVVAGVPHWAILAFATFVLAMVTVGPALVWGPVAIWLWLDGHVMLALFATAWGFLVVGFIDNIVRTVAISRTSDLPASLAFLGAIGGLLAWGVIGVLLGPVIVALCRQLVLTWATESTVPGS